MKIQLEACGKLSDYIPENREFETTARTVDELLEELATQLPDMRADLRRTAIARGEMILGRNADIADGDQLALIPPVGGG